MLPEAENHPTRPELEGFVKGDLTAQENRLVLRHLLAQCPLCREATGELWQAAAGEAPLPAELLQAALRPAVPRPTEEDAYDRSLSRVFQQVRAAGAILHTERAGAEGLFAELMGETPERRRERIATERRFQTWGLCELLIERCQAGRYTAQREGMELADLAVAVAGRLDPATYNPALLEDLRARAWAHLANARRVLSDLRGAEEAFVVAEEHLACGTGDRLEKARLLDLLASLRNYQGRLDEATRLLNRAIAIYRRAEQHHLVGRALLNKAHVRIWAGDSQTALVLLREGLAQIDPGRDAKLTLSAHHNLACVLNDLGRYGEAAELLERSRPLYLDCGHLIQLRSLEGHIALGLGRLPEAEAALRDTRAEFSARGMAYDAALASLDLAEVYLLQGRPAEIRELAQEMLAIFESREQHREAIAAMILFQNAAEAQSVTLGVVHEVAGRVQQIRRQAGGPAF